MYREFLLCITNFAAIGGAYKKIEKNSAVSIYKRKRYKIGCRKKEVIRVTALPSDRWSTHGFIPQTIKQERNRFLFNESSCRLDSSYSMQRLGIGC